MTKKATGRAGTRRAAPPTSDAARSDPDRDSPEAANGSVAGDGLEAVDALLAAALRPLAGTRRGRGRPRKTPTEDQIDLVRRLAFLGLTMDECALAIGIAPSTFHKYRESHFSEALKRGQVFARISSALVLAREMRAGNMTALIWYERTRLGYTEKTHMLVSDPNGNPVQQHVRHSGEVAIGLFLPPNGRDVPAAVAGAFTGRTAPSKAPPS